MKFYLVTWLLVQSVIGYVNAYLPFICSTNGGICIIEDLNQMANTFIDNISNYAHDGYMVYCRYICTIFQYIFGTWINFNGRMKPTTWQQRLYNDYFLPILTWLGLEEEKDDSVEDLVCSSSVPFLIILCSFGFYGLTTYLKRKSKLKEEPLIAKFDLSAFSQEPDEEDANEIQSEATYSTLLNEYDGKSCCDCNRTLSEIS